MTDNNTQYNVPEEFSRTAMLLGDDTMQVLKSSCVAVFGIGGVGGYAAEALCRAGIGHLILVDSDCVSRSNINRQIIATQKTVGMKKVDAARERLLSINPELRLDTYDIFYGADTADKIDLSGCNCVVDAIDTVTNKLLLIENCARAGIQVVSCMGAGNKLDPTQFEVCDIYETSFCPLARVMRKELRRRGVTGLRVVYSQEPPVIPVNEVTDGVRRSVPGSVSFCAPAAGLACAAEAVRLLTRGV